MLTLDFFNHNGFSHDYLPHDNQKRAQGAHRGKIVRYSPNHTLKTTLRR